MHRVHWTDPDWKITWGLGFSVRKDGNGNTVVRHGGSCPGYRSEFALYPKSKRAYAVMINASGTSPGKYVQGIAGILKKVKPTEKKEESEAEEESKNLSEYTGYYDEQPWWGELYVSTSNGKLVIMSLPSSKPAKSITLFKHIEGDTFQRIRDDEELGETITFQRDVDGKIVSLKRHGNFSMRLER